MRNATSDSVTTLTFRRPRLVFLLLMVLIAAGAAALLAIGRQEDQTITNLFATITTRFPGASPARVETLVTKEVESAMKEIAEIDEITSSSATGISVVNVELIETLPDDEIEIVWTEVRDAIEDARAQFPAGVLAPEVDADGISAYAAIASLSIADSQLPMTIVGRYAEELADQLRNIPGTKQVEIFGQPEEEVLVTVDQNRAAALGITVQQISAAIRQADAKVQAGKFQNSRNDLILEVSGEIEALDRLREVIVRESTGTTATRLSDIATVTRGARSPVQEAALLNSAPAVLVAATLEEGLQIDAWAGYVRTEIDQFATPNGISLDLIFDQSIYTSKRLTEVGTNMLIGVSLVVIVLLLTLGVRAAAIVALILPVVTLATLATMNAIGLAVHQMSVTGLIVALGLLVDAGIVMSDEVARRIRHGTERVIAVSQAVKRLAAPLFASTATTALSFTPMILLPGPAGDFVGSIAIAVVIMLFWSLFIALTITPALAGWLMPGHERTTVFNSGIPSGLPGRLFKKSLLLARFCSAMSSLPHRLFR